MDINKHENMTNVEKRQRGRPKLTLSSDSVEEKRKKYREYAKAYREQNRDNMRKYQRDYYGKHKVTLNARRREYMRNYYHEHKDEYKNRQKTYIPKFKSMEEVLKEAGVK